MCAGNIKGLIKGYCFQNKILRAGSNYLPVMTTLIFLTSGGCVATWH